MQNLDHVAIRNLREEDIEKLAHTFTSAWSPYEATLKVWRKYFQEQQAGVRSAYVLEYQNNFLGYGSLLRSSEYPHFRESGIPEINALWIDEKCRRRGLGKRLIEYLENKAREEGYKTVGIGVGLYKDYGSAQKLYFKLGYSPDGNGITSKGSFVVAGEKYPLDDDLIFWLTKDLAPKIKSFRFHFRHIQKSERALMHFWLTQPHAAKWFYGDGLENTHRHLDAFFAGSAFTQYWLGLDQDQPFVFLITSRVNKPHDELSRWCSKDGETITLDMLIGDVSFLGKGYAVQVIQEFLLSQFSNIDEVLIDPEATNSLAIHVYEKAGFQKVGEFVPSHSPNLHLMMRLNMKEFKQQLLK